jgi:glutathione peroxidase
MPSIFDYSATLSNGIDTPLSDYKGQVLLVVNTASRCGYNEYKDSGFSVLAFPCNQFGAQEPGSTADIVDFCTTRFQTTFPLFEKIDVNGDNAHPLYKHLKSTVKGIMGTERIKWNFTKFLINREGEVVARYGSQKKPADIAKDISSLL